MKDVDTSQFPEQLDPDEELGVEPRRWPLWKILVVVLVVGAVPCILLTGLLAALVVPDLVHTRMLANESKAKADIANIAAAVDQYAIANNGHYPANLRALVTPDADGFTYLGQEIFPRDPWGNEYVYEPPPAGTHDYLVRTFGADGAPGGEHDNRDIDNVMIREGR